ncbi:16S rRNA (cytidine(1402)-2'-O)-methyltransferase [Mycoplasma iguanae]|uniref:Ribosomal RNA small subunit methyltransferase I n=1 Tax=Mycoplasma iguanae TaxID=292461 RepID=A0ABY5RAJ2_9MOLU|nr:16S rRNA (cytidine(1402)-2'-O)-methyltransferase [Mycoplasma iguanae]UVD81772.1 16S rRNA (cytidine(1402)-2'-O)-methyltransferase [Mycoplasma iguanae]
MQNKYIYIVATPIGNLKDITLRAIEILKEVDYIAAEDTRTSQKLLNHYQIKKPLISLHKFNEQKAAQKIIDLVEEGNDLALISDAGTPLISDPGNLLIKLARENNIEIRSIPGPSALTSIIALSGFSTPITFLGFLKDKTGQRQKQIASLIEGTYVIYVAPHKLRSTLEDVVNFLNPNLQHQIFLAKELTKKFEKHYFGNAHDILLQLPENIKGEYSLAIFVYQNKITKEKNNKYSKYSKNVLKEYN